MQRNAFRFAAWMFLGSLALQTAWVLAMPPFRGADEFDHAYRAAAVATGQWTPSGVAAQDGRGELVRVPLRLVEDAGPVCAELRYTGPDNCTAVDRVDADTVTVATAAARYNPVYYWLVGTASVPFDGAEALYAMRTVSAVLCSLLIAAGAWVTGRWARTVWPYVGVLAALTPMAVHSTAVAAPNGLELCAALGLWVTLLGLDRVGDDERRLMIVLATVFALPLTTVRGLGPLWLGCILLIWLVQLGPLRAYRVLRQQPATTLVCAAVVVSATAAATRWTLTRGSLELDEAGPYENLLLNTVKSVPAWFLQSIAAFPLRNEPAPTVVYPAVGIVLTLIMVTGWLRASGQARRALLVAFAFALLVPFLLQLSVIESAGTVWQGRYGWPLSMGVLLLCAAALEDRPPRHRLSGAVLLAGAGLWAMAHVVSTVNVVVQELESSPLAGDGRWLVADPWAIGALATLGALVMAAVLRSSPGRPGLPGIASTQEHPRPTDVAA